MRARLSFIACSALVAGMLAAPQFAAAQGFSADYGLVGGALSPAEPAGAYRSGLLELGGVRLGPALQADRQFSGAGLSLAAGQNWFAQVAVGRSLQLNPVLPGVTASDAIRVGGGYRWSDGQSLSLQVTGGRALGLQVSYDWPHYFRAAVLRLQAQPEPARRALFRRHAVLRPASLTRRRGRRLRPPRTSPCWN